MISLLELQHRIVKPEYWFEGTMLALDPGEITGYTLLTATKDSLTFNSGQLATFEVKLVDKLISPLIDKCSLCVAEDYKVYSWKSDSHKWAALHTPQMVGAMHLLCAQRNIYLHLQMAQLPKQFVTDDKLKSWGIYQRGQKHARDAIRHAIYFLLFTYPALRRKKILTAENKR